MTLVSHRQGIFQDLESGSPKIAEVKYLVSY